MVGTTISHYKVLEKIGEGGAWVRFSGPKEEPPFVPGDRLLIICLNCFSNRGIYLQSRKADGAAL